MSLISNGVAESRTLEYKSTLPGRTDGEKKEFLADVSAMANTAGGVLVYGVETGRDMQGADTGVPARVVGLSGVTLDQEKLRLGNMIQAGLSPSLASAVAFQDVSVAGVPDPVLLLGVPRSLAAPHMVVFQGSNKFWRRSEAGKYPPEVSELRRMFLEPRSWTAEAEAFRRERVNWTRAGGQPSLDLSSSVFIHLLPLGRLEDLLDIRAHQAKMITLAPPPMNSGWDYAFNADGFMTFTPQGSMIRSYTQWFRFGGIEGYSARFVGRHRSGLPQQTDQYVLLAPQLGHELRSYTRQGLTAMRDLWSLDPPFVTLISLIGCSRTRLLDAKGLPGGQPVVRDPLFLPPVIFEEEGADVDRTLAPLIDVIWQAGGFAGAPTLP